MNLGIIAGVGLGIASICGCATDVSEANAPLVPPAAAPTPLVPEAYTALAAAVAPAPPPLAQLRLPPAPAPDPAPAPAVAARPVPSPVNKSNQYHPYWVVDVH